jgi:hypothetical protein
MNGTIKAAPLLTPTALLKKTSFDAVYFPVNELPEPCQAALRTAPFALKNQFSPFSSTTPMI